MKAGYLDKLLAHLWLSCLVFAYIHITYDTCPYYSLLVSISTLWYLLYTTEHKATNHCTSHFTYVLSRNLCEKPILSYIVNIRQTWSQPQHAIISYFLHHDTIVSVRYVIMFCTLFTLTFSLLSSKIYDYSFFFHADSTNRVFNVTIDTGSRSPVVTFQFLNGPVTSATCTVEYGTDPAYVYLPNTDSFNGLWSGTTPVCQTDCKICWFVISCHASTWSIVICRLFPTTNTILAVLPAWDKDTYHCVNNIHHK